MAHMVSSPSGPTYTAGLVAELADIRQAYFKLLWPLVPFNTVGGLLFVGPGQMAQ